MARTREIPIRDWELFLQRFNERNQGRPVRLESILPPGTGEPPLVRRQPLLGVDVEAKGSEAPAIITMLGGLGPHMPQSTHVIHDPTGMRVEEAGDGLAIELVIESEAEGETFLIFESVDPEPGA
jgi:hypothetical protein